MVHGRPDVGHGGGHDLPGGDSVGGQLLGIGAEGIGGDQAAARLQILPVDVLDGLGILDAPQVGQQTVGQTGRLEHAAQAAVQVVAFFLNRF